MANVILKNRDGYDLTYEGVQAVELNTADGGKQIFTAGETEEKSVELDFSAGNMEVTPSGGKLLTKVSIPMPENLLPANIAEGVNIAGIVGTLAASGGNNVRFASGSITGASGSDFVRINHGLGVVPDLFFAYLNKLGAAPSTASSSVLTSCILLSNALKEAIGCSHAGLGVTPSSTTKKVYQGLSIDSPLEIGGAPLFSKATANEILLGCSSYSVAGYNYVWGAITGLLDN